MVSFSRLLGTHTFYGYTGRSGWREPGADNDPARETLLDFFFKRKNCGIPPRTLRRYIYKATWIVPRDSDTHNNSKLSPSNVKYHNWGTRITQLVTWLFFLLANRTWLIETWLVLLMSWGKKWNFLLVQVLKIRSQTTFLTVDILMPPSYTRTTRSNLFYRHLQSH